MDFLKRLFWTQLEAIVGKKSRAIIFKKMNLSFQRIELMQSLNIDYCIDVGANIGQWALHVRETGFTGQILSLEPDTRAYTLLREVASKDLNNNWEVKNIAAGDAKGELEFNFWGVDGGSSSFLQLTSGGETFTHHNNSDIPKNKVPVDTLDQIISAKIIQEKNILLKIDVQGFEKQVLDGSIESLKSIAMIDIELPIFDIYEGAEDLPTMLKWLDEHNFQLCSLQTERWTGYGAADIDALFVRRDLYESLVKSNAQ
jgi:FkbM family methyltransferase